MPKLLYYGQRYFMQTLIDPLVVNTSWTFDAILCMSSVYETPTKLLSDNLPSLFGSRSFGAKHALKIWFGLLNARQVEDPKIWKTVGTETVIDGYSPKPNQL